MVTLLAWLVTTKTLKPFEVEWLLGNFPYDNPLEAYTPLTDTTWRIPQRVGHIDIGFETSDYADRWPEQWVADMRKALSKPLRPAKLSTFITMEYDGGENPEHQAAWDDMLMLAQVGTEHCRWPLALCQVSADRSTLRVVDADGFMPR